MNKFPHAGKAVPFYLNLPKPSLLKTNLTYSHFQPTGSSGSSPCSTPTPGSQVTKVTATAKFKVEVHAPSASVERPSSSRSRSRRSCPSRSASSASTIAAGATSLQPTPPGSVHSSLTDSIRSSVSSSLSSNDGDLGFSEK